MGRRGRKYSKINAQKQKINSIFKSQITSNSNGFDDTPISVDDSGPSYSTFRNKSVPVEKSPYQNILDVLKMIGAAVVILIPVLSFFFWIASINYKVEKNSEGLSEIKNEDKEVSQKIDDLLKFKISSSKDIAFFKEVQDDSKERLRELSKEVRAQNIEKSNRSIQSNANAPAD
jgi:hypothetical protein